MTDGAASEQALGPLARRLFSSLAHAGDADGKPQIGEAGRQALGTRVRFALAIQDGRLRQVRYRAYGCPHTLATCEWLAQALEGSALPVAYGTPADWAERLAVPAHKLGRLLVVEDALRSALGPAGGPDSTGLEAVPLPADDAVTKAE